jgi:hypothetical protein
MANIRGRLALAEKALNEGGDGLTVIFVRGGLTDDASNEHATAGDVEFHRGADESSMAFRSRCELAAREMNAPTLVFGGLPPANWSN